MKIRSTIRSVRRKNEVFDDDALVYYIVKVIEHFEDIHQVADKNYIANDLLELIQKIMII